MNVTYTSHATSKMIARDIRRSTLEYVLQRGGVIEEYPDDPRGDSYLVLGWSGERPILVVAADIEDETIVITTYEPDPEKWSDDFKQRVR